MAAKTDSPDRPQPRHEPHGVGAVARGGLLDRKGGEDYVPVIGGHQYIAFVTSQSDGAPFGGPLESSGAMALNQDDLYTAGQFAFNTSGNPATGPWSLTLSNADPVFHATFVSEASTLVLFAVGLAGLIAVTASDRRR